VYVLVSRAFDVEEAAGLVVMSVFRISVWSAGNAGFIYLPVVLARTFGALWLTTVLAKAFGTPVSIDTWWAMAATAVLLFLAEAPMLRKERREDAERRAKEAEQRLWHHDPIPPVTDFGNPPYR
jgi:hypothetical protein